MLRNFLTYLLCFALVCYNAAFGEAIDDTFALPQDQETGKIHGAKTGKPLIRILMFGAIPAQGIHFVPEGTDLLFAILYAGGYTDRSKLNGISIRRRGLERVLEVDLEDSLAAGDVIPKLRDGDIVNVPYNWRKSFEEFQFITNLVFSLSTFILSIVAVTK